MKPLGNLLSVSTRLIAIAQMLTKGSGQGTSFCI